MPSNVSNRIGIISFPAFYRGLGYGGWANSGEASALKTMALLYNRILVAAPSEQVAHACKHFSNEYNLDLDYLLSSYRSIEEIDENILYSDFFAEMCAVSIGQKFELLYKKYGRYWYNKLFHSGQFHILSMVALPLWNVALRMSPNLALIETPDLPKECKTQQFQSALSPERMKIVWDDIQRIGVPDPGCLPWKTVIKLSMSENKKKFVEIILQLGNKSVYEEIVESLWDDFSATKQNVKTMVAKSIISSIPLPIPVNPLSVLFSIQDISAEHERQNKTSWLSFLSEARSYRNEPPDSPPLTDAWGWAGWTRSLNPNFTPPKLAGID